MGTGWLVRPDVMVTAGHCAYDWRDALGRAVHINAYIGYHGKASIMTDPNVQTRRAKRIVTTSGWLTSKKNRINDVSFVLLNKPFTQVKPFTFDSTPTQGDEMLGVVGYPGDKIDKIGATEEKGAKMYQQFAKVKYNLETSEQHMLQYRISTYAGKTPQTDVQGTLADYLCRTVWIPSTSFRQGQYLYINWCPCIWRRHAQLGERCQ